jgi:predicted DNA-binding transcriptional regulator YafY
MQREAIERLKRIDHLIHIKGTGTPAQLANRIGISERSIYLYLNLMRDLGAPIKFDNYRQTYYYDPDGSFFFSFFPKDKKSEQHLNGS